MKTIRNIAYIDGQNLYMATAHADQPWCVDMHRFREYLARKFDVVEAYYFIGAFDYNNQQLYNDLQNAGFALVFREHGRKFKSHKKGNIDVDLTFQVMRDLYKRDDMGGVVIVSGDGDYYRMVRFLVDEGKFEKILLPNRQYSSSLYNRLGARYLTWLDAEGVRSKIAKKKR